MNWLVASFFSLCSFGLWGFFSKLAVLHIDSRSALVFQTIGVLLIGLATLYLVNFRPATDMRGIGFALLTGLAYGIGCLLYLIAVSKGKVVTVVTLTALYPIITILLSYVFLKETVTLRQGVGILLALLSILLMAA